MSENSENTRNAADTVANSPKIKQNILKKLNQAEMQKTESRKKCVIAKILGEYHKTSQELLSIQDKIDEKTSKEREEQINQIFEQKIVLLQKFFNAFTELSSKINSTDAILTRKKLKIEMKIDTYDLIAKYYEELSSLFQQFANALEVSAIKEIGEENWNDIDSDLSDTQNLVDAIIQNMHDMSDTISESVKKMYQEDEKQISSLSDDLQNYIKEFTIEQGEIETLTYRCNIIQIQTKKLYDLQEVIKKEFKSLKEKKDQQVEKEEKLKSDITELEKQLRKINRNARKLEEYEGLEKGEAFQLSTDELINIRMRMICDDLQAKLGEEL